MIAKRVSMKSIKKSDFSELVKYLTDTQQKNERVGQMIVTNCHSGDPAQAALEILNVQGLNKRAKSDKTYHLIISFAPGESLEDDTLLAIEARLCRALGFGEHQRISVVHHDTDNLHIHVAINKIHPTRYTIHEPRRDYSTLGDLCEKIEHEYGLKKFDHQGRKYGAENRAADMEHHTGIESLLGWIQRQCHVQIESAQSWDELHQVMQANGLTLRERGNGLVFEAADDVIVKASSVDRNFSMNKLEQKLGPFQPPPERHCQAEASRQYSQKPALSRVGTVELYGRYQGDQSSAYATRSIEWTKARERKDRAIKAAKRSGSMKRAFIKLLKGSRLEKKAAYALVGSSLKNDIVQINKTYFKERQLFADRYRRMMWADWLRQRATEGDEEALLALRARHPDSGLLGNTLFGKCKAQGSVGSVPHQDSVTKKGAIIYRMGATAVRDNGDKLNVSRGATHDGLQGVLQLAVARYGECICVEGTDAFKDQIVRAAVAADLHIRFDAADLERRRQELIQQSTAEEKNHERPEMERSAGSGPAHTGSDNARHTRSRRPTPERLGRAAGRAARPDAEGIGKEPPPVSRNRLRDLSELGVVHIASGTEVLLQGHVPARMEQQGTVATDRVRRDRPGLVADSAAIAAADKYIFEREQKRFSGFDIPQHKRYDGLNGPALFAGLRKIDGKMLALLKTGNDIVVLPIDETVALRLKRLKLGQALSLNAEGQIKKKGRRR